MNCMRLPLTDILSVGSFPAFESAPTSVKVQCMQRNHDKSFGILFFSLPTPSVTLSPPMLSKASQANSDFDARLPTMVKRMGGKKH